MSFSDLVNRVQGCAVDLSNWSKVREEIINRHKNAASVDEYITLLSLHSMLMDHAKEQLSSNAGLEEINTLQSQDYKMLLKREYIIGGSVCIDTLYELTQRELEAGRMSPEDELIDLAVNAIAEPHYTREQLMRQKDKINKTNKIENDSNISKKLRNKISQIFK